jgi:CubicO group peptidase (beta-lactamase class C family)
MPFPAALPGSFPAALNMSKSAPDGISPSALKVLLDRAGEAHSDALVIMKDGHLVVEEYFGKEQGTIELMSCTKSVVALAMGKIIEDHLIDSLDQPVYTFYPEWKQGTKQEITIRHLLNHTSGLQNYPDTRIEIYPSPDAIKLGLAAEISEKPGNRFRYNNKAVNLLSGIIELASGKRMDYYLQETVLEPLSIFTSRWQMDPSGRPYAMAGLQLHATDLARLGQLVLDKGLWIDERIITAEWIEEMLKPGQSHHPQCGLLW